MSGTNYSDNTEINVLNKILGKFPKSQLATFDYPLTVINNSLTALYDEINAGINVTIENFPSLQDVLVKNTTLSVDVSNFPATQDVLVKNTTLSVDVSNMPDFQFTTTTKYLLVDIENFPSLQDVLVKNTTLSVDVSNFPATQDVLVKNTTLSVDVSNFPATQDVLVKNTTLSVDVLNFPSVQDTAPQNTTITPTEDTLSTTATTAVQLTATSTLVNVLILSNVSTTDTIYIGFSSGSQPHAISPNGKFIYDNEIRQINLNTIYIKGSGGIDIGYTYFN